MNILVINTTTDLYGANRILLQTIKALSPRKILLAVPSYGPLTDIIIKSPHYSHVNVIVIKTIPLVFRKMNLKRGYHLIKNVFLFSSAIKKIKQSHSINWVYVNTLSSFVVLKILKSLHLKILLHVHEILENEKLFTQLINRYSIKWADIIIAVSKPVELNLQGAYKKNNIVTVLNGITDMFLPQVATNPSVITITLFARIKPEKGIWFFLDAIALLNHNSVEKAHFIIIGSAAPGGDYYVEKLKKDILKHPANKNIEFKSFVSDIKEILNSSDIIVVPSLMKDPFPTTILEAASAGKPVIATNTGGAVQSVKDNLTGFLISSSDTKKFAQRLEVLIESEQLRIEMGIAARKLYLENFTLDIFTQKILKVIENFEAGKSSIAL